MKQKEKETLKNLSLEELKAELRQAREKYAGLAFKHVTNPLANPLEMRTLRRKIAMVETFVSQKEAPKADLKEVE